MERARQSGQIVNLGFRKETVRDGGVIGLCSDVFDINADIGRRDGDDGQIARVRKAESKAAAERRVEVRLAECIVDITYVPGSGPEIVCEDVA